MSRPWRDRLLDALGPVYKPRLDRHRAERVYRRFDEAAGFGRYNEVCRAAFARQSQACRDTPVHRDGLHHLKVLAPERAAALLEAIQAHSRAGLIKGGKRQLEGLRVDDEGLRERILSEVLTDAIDRHLIGYFGSEYLVLWMTVTATAPAADAPSVSFRWHCDKGPRTHLKLIVYLNGSLEHGGNTEFVPLPDTAAVAARGYLFGRVESRTDDVGELSAVAGRPVASTMQEMPAGGGVIFQPGTVLHRGVTPTRGTRYTVTLCLLPSPVPWREALARGTLLDLAVDPKWPRHADDLLQALGHPAGK